MNTNRKYSAFSWHGIRNEDQLQHEKRTILGNPPQWISTWGIGMVAVIFMLLFSIMYFVHYPDVIAAKISIITHNPPASLKARTSGKITLLEEEGARVEDGQWLAIMENTANHSDIRYLSEVLRRCKISAVSVEKTKLKFHENLSLGEIQPAYNKLLAALRTYHSFYELRIDFQQLMGLRKQYEMNKSLVQKFQDQALLFKEELLVRQKKLLRDSLLFSSQTIAASEMETSASIYLQALRGYETNMSTMATHEIRLEEMENRIRELTLVSEEKRIQLENDFQFALRDLQGSYDAWEHNYLIKAPYKGRVALYKYWSNGQYVNAGEEVLNVLPESGVFFGQLTVPVIGSGKIKKNQRVLIKLDGYPFQEFGMITGHVSTISMLPRDGMYMVNVQLDTSTVSTRNIEIQLKQEMQGNAEIITTDLRIIDRLINQFYGYKTR